MSKTSTLKIILYCLFIIINGCIPASSSESLPESDHLYANNFEKTWTISEPGATQIRLHFEYIQLASDEGLFINDYDEIILLDKFDNELAEYGNYYGFKIEDLWTEWYTGDTLKVKLVTDGSTTDYGFKIDKIETRNIEPSEVEPSNVESSNLLTATALSSSANSSTFGQSVTFTAKVDTSSDESGEPFGTVTFMDEDTSIGIADLSSGQATLTTSSLLVGSHSITAEYSGDIDFKSSTSSPLVLTVQEQASTEEDSNIGQNVPTEQTDTESSKIDEKPIWENPVFSIIIAPLTVAIIAPLIVGIITDMIKKKYFPQLRKNK